VNRSGTNSKNCDEMAQLILPTREDMIVKIKKHEKIPTLGEILEMRAQAREQLFTVGQLDKVGQNGPSVEKPSS